MDQGIYGIQGLDEFGQLNLPFSNFQHGPQTPIQTPIQTPSFMGGHSMGGGGGGPTAVATPIMMPTMPSPATAMTTTATLQQQQQQQQSLTAAPAATSQHPPAFDMAAAARGDRTGGVVPQLQNVVSTVNLSMRLNLKFIAMHARNAEYNPKRFAAVIMRIRDPKTTSLIFGSGKMVCTGAKSEEASRTASRKYARIIKKLGFNVKFTEFKVQNIVGSCDVGFPIGLDRLHAEHGAFCSYEPELFPGLVYRMHDLNIVLLIFVSGKVVLTGAKTRQAIYQAFDNIYSILLQFRKQSVAARAPTTPSAAAGATQRQMMPPPATPSAATAGQASSSSQQQPLYRPPSQQQSESRDGGDDEEEMEEDDVDE